MIVRALDPTADDEVELVAQRMRETLGEVLGAERGQALYTLDWLRDRLPRRGERHGPPRP